MRRFVLLAGLVVLCMGWTAIPAHAASITLGVWRLGEDDAGAANGVIANDPAVGISGAANLTRVGDPKYSTLLTAPGTSTTSVVFDGTDDVYFTNAVPSTATDNFGLEAWVNPTALDGFNFAVSNGANTNGGWGIVQVGGNWSVIHSGVALSAPGPAVELNTWTHLAMVRDNGLTTLYVNGAPTAATIAPAPSAPLDYFMIGANKVAAGFEGRFKGAIDDVRVFEFNPGEFNPATDLSYPPVPEPSTAALAFAAIAVVAGRRIYRRHRIA
jgi:hypothetical protein